MVRAFLCEKQPTNMKLCIDAEVDEMCLWCEYPQFDIAHGFTSDPLTFSKNAVKVTVPNKLRLDIAQLIALKMVDPLLVEMVHIKRGVAADDRTIDLLTKFPNLKILVASNCSLVTSLEPLTALEKLEIVRLQHCHGLVTTEPIKALSRRRTVGVLNIRHISGHLWRSWA